jgi:ADP-ribosylglycohydrolase
MTEPSQTARLARATTCLTGLAVGDALGGFFEFAGANARRRIAERWLLSPPWRRTDDTQMAGAVLATLAQAGELDQDRLAAELAARYEHRRGYGMASRAVLSRLRRGADWRVEAAGLFGGDGSWPAAASMRRSGSTTGAASSRWLPSATSPTGCAAYAGTRNARCSPAAVRMVGSGSGTWPCYAV